MNFFEFSNLNLRIPLEENQRVSVETELFSYNPHVLFFFANYNPHVLIISSKYME